MAGFFQLMVVIKELFLASGGDQSGDASSGALNHLRQDLLVRKWLQQCSRFPFVSVCFGLNFCLGFLCNFGWSNFVCISCL